MTSTNFVPTIKSRVLIAGATGCIGQFIVEACLESGRSTYVLVRHSPSNVSKTQVINSLEEKGAIVLHGAIDNKENMVKLLKEHEIDIVISAVGGATILHQLSLVEAIKEVGTVKRFLPSEFGHDVDRADPVEPGLNMYLEKRKIRRLIEVYNVPYTYICCNSIASWPYYDNTHPSEVLPPLDSFGIYGDGTVKAYFVAGKDIGKFTVKTLEDVRTLNKMIHFRPSCNYYNMNELASLWEKKIGRTLSRFTVTEDHLLAAAAENRIPESIVASFTHDIFIKGCQSNFIIDGPNEVEVTALYPEEPFRTLEECFNDFAAKLNDKEKKKKNTVINSDSNKIKHVGCDGKKNFIIDGPNEVEVTTLYPEKPFRILEECFNDFAAKLNDKEKKKNNYVINSDSNSNKIKHVGCEEQKTLFSMCILTFSFLFVYIWYISLHLLFCDTGTVGQHTHVVGANVDTGAAAKQATSRASAGINEAGSL